MLFVAVSLLLVGCVGQVSLDAEEEVTPGAALGFASINYVSTRRSPEGVFQQDALDIDATGRTTLVVARSDTAAAREPFRFLPEAKLLEVRRNFAASNFFTWSDSVYGEGPAPRTQSIVFEVDGRIDQLIRHNEAPVPPEILVLMEQLEVLVAEGFYGNGVPVPVEPVLAGERTQIDRRAFVVVKSQEALLDLLFRMGSIEISVLPRIDFGREMLVSVFLGSQAGPTLSVEIDSTAYRYPDRVQVLYRRHDAHEGCELSARPFALATLPRMDVPVEFFEAGERDTARCEVGSP